MTNADHPVPPPTAPPTRPGAVTRPALAPKAVWPTVVGVIGVIFGAGGALLSCLQGVWFVAFDSIEHLIPTVANQPNPIEALGAWMPAMVILGAVSMVAAIALLVGSIGLLKHKPWCAPVLIWWAIAKLVISISEGVIGYFMNVDLMSSMSQQGNAGFTLPTLVALFGAFFNLVFYGAFPAFVLVWLNLSGPKREIERWRSDELRLSAPPAPPPQSPSSPPPSVSA